MRQTLALLQDAYRDLNARKLFWVTLLISVAIVLGLSAVGVEPEAITVFGKRWEREDASAYYRGIILSNFIITIWLSWGAVTLALISTAGIFPDLIASGAIDLYLSKPISRLRLFFTKYLAGMMFVILQLTVLCTGCYLVAGLRAHEWRPSLFLAIPYVALLFSYMYAVCVLLGVWTRSTITALLLTILLWLMLNSVSYLNTVMGTMHKGLDLKIAHAKSHIRVIEAREKKKAAEPPRTISQMFSLENAKKSAVTALSGKEREKCEQDIKEAEDDLKTVRVVHRLAAETHRWFPKPRETNNLLDRRLISDDEIPSEVHAQGSAPPPILGVSMADLVAAGYEVNMAAREESPSYVIGSSLIFEAVVVGFAAWIFCRRDY